MQRQESVIKSLSNLTSVQLMFSVWCAEVQGIGAALLVLSVSLLLPDCTYFSKVKHVNWCCLFCVISEGFSVFSLKTTQVSVAPISCRSQDTGKLNGFLKKLKVKTGKGSGYGRVAGWLCAVISVICNVCVVILLLVCSISKHKGKVTEVQALNIYCLFTVRKLS